MTRSAASLVPLKILLVEDQPLDAELIVAALERSGYTVAPVERVETPEQFSAQLELSPDIILCDYGLPRFNALEALRLLEARRLSIPFIIISGSIGEETAVEAIKRGADDYLLKDRLGRLGPAVAQAMAKNKLRAAAERAEEDLRQSEFKYRCLFEHLLDAAFLCDAATGRIIDTNERGEALLGLERSAILGSRLGHFIPPATWNALQAFAQSKADLVSGVETEITGPEGNAMPMHISATIVAIYARRLLFTFFRAPGDGRATWEKSGRASKVA
jgi:PAS domain S-box-containing protein